MLSNDFLQGFCQYMSPLSTSTCNLSLRSGRREPLRYICRCFFNHNPKRTWCHESNALMLLVIVRMMMIDWGQGSEKERRKGSKCDWQMGNRGGRWRVDRAERREVKWCDDVMWYDLIWCDMLLCDVIWCDVICYDVMWCDMLWCDVL